MTVTSVVLPVAYAYRQSLNVPFVKRVIPSGTTASFANSSDGKLFSNAAAVVIHDGRVHSRDAVWTEIRLERYTIEDDHLLLNDGMKVFLLQGGGTASENIS